MTGRNASLRHWAARALVALVFASNMYCAVSFIADPGAYTSAYQLSGAGAQAAVAGIGVAFSMWNVTYLPLIVFPYKFPVLFGVVIAQQVVGLAGETWIHSQLGASAAIASASILRFIVFDAVGLVLLIMACILTTRK